MGLDSPRVAVITPFFNVPAGYLARCVASVASQSYACHHLVVADGASESALGQDGPLGFARDASIIRIPAPHADFGDTPRLIGSISAFARGFDAVAWLDADNWYAQDHIASLVELARTSRAPVCTSTRYLCDLDGGLLGACPETHPALFIDTSCFYVTRAARALLGEWLTLESHEHAIGDRIFLAGIRKRGVVPAHTGRATVFYRTAYIEHYEYFGKPIPASAKRGNGP